MGVYDGWLHPSSLDPEKMDVLKNTIATYKKLRPSLHGDRYVMDGPAVVIEPEVEEADNWEAYQYLSPDAEVVSVFFFRCASAIGEHRAVLRGLDPGARYWMESHSGQLKGTLTGEELMDSGLVCRLDSPRSADVVVLTRL